MKKALLAGLLSFMLLTLCGCDFTLAPQELYSLPKLPAEYMELDSRINAILTNGAEYAAPTSGTNIQPVQLMDLDGDGQEEALAFFRKADDEKPLKIYIFTAREQSYEQTAVIESSGSSIYSIAYSDMDGDGRTELVVGWRASTDLQALSVYTLRGGEAVELMHTNYVKYDINNLDLDELNELVVLRADDEGGGVADYYGWQNGGLLLRSSARISMTMAELSQQGRVTKGTLQNGEPALFVTGVEDAARAITDILTSKNGELSNIVLSDVTGVSTEIALFCTLYPMDINGDGLTEVPCPVRLPDWDDEGISYQRIDWRSYDSDGNATTALSTYHDIEDGWYLQLPAAWAEQLAAARSVAPEEASVTFYRMADQEPLSFLRISAITGNSREIKAARGGRFILGRSTECIFAAELLEGNHGWEDGMTEDEVRAAFNLITKEWLEGNA